MQTFALRQKLPDFTAEWTRLVMTISRAVACRPEVRCGIGSERKLQYDSAATTVCLSPGNGGR